MEQLQKVLYAIWYLYLGGHYTYDFACDVWESLLPLKDSLRAEK